ncbi:ribonuclease M5 [Anaerococcus sp. AGMB00486]|uniref:Ribonuclease M5 n=2 Tax=Anaerococcus TaxID=165779 RepID=A0ABX2NA27_9FIRM|nr:MULTISPECIES: ribonuclease M5 [Anaerococcus]MDY3006735.1 ribonuclease M5 [Anaerococcus porci]MSS77698.1 ribonuclease M5 [Anaerococcus porci]NVF11554.1 ribonuclease M5 [Anaerococcus faecalis]
MIKETIVVEGKDDITNIKSAIDCELIATNGLAFGHDLIDRLKEIDKRCGIIIFTDPDFAGKKIREKIAKEIPNAKHAFLDRNKAIKKGDLGIENASKDDIINALKNAHASTRQRREEFTIKDLLDNNLTLSKSSKERRARLGDILSIGYFNSKQLLSKLNSFNISREEFESAVKKI